MKNAEYQYIIRRWPEMSYLAYDLKKGPKPTRRLIGLKKCLQRGWQIEVVPLESAIRVNGQYCDFQVLETFT